MDPLFGEPARPAVFLVASRDTEVGEIRVLVDGPEDRADLFARSVCVGSIHGGDQRRIYEMCPEDGDAAAATREQIEYVERRVTDCLDAHGYVATEPLTVVARSFLEPGPPWLIFARVGLIEERAPRIATRVWA